MTLQEEKIQADRIPGTSEIGCPARTLSPACLRASQAHAVVPMQPSRSGDGRVAVTAATQAGQRVGAGPLFIRHSEERAGVRLITAIPEPRLACPRR